MAALLGGYLGRHIDHQSDVEISPPSPLRWKSFPAEAKLLSGPAPRGDLQHDLSVEGLNPDLPSQHRLPRHNLHLRLEMVVAEGELRMRKELHPDEEVSRRSAPLSRLPLTGEPDPIAVADAGRDRHGEIFFLGHLSGAAAAAADLAAVDSPAVADGAERLDLQADAAFSPMRRLFQRQLHLRFDVTPAEGALGRRPSESSPLGAAPSPGRPAAEERLEKVGESPHPLEIFEMKLFRRGAPPCSGGRGLVLHPLSPLRPQLVVFGPLLRVSENLVRLVDLLEFFLGLLLDLSHMEVGMVLPGQLAVGVFNLFFGRRAGHAEHLVIVSEFHRHATFFPLGSVQWVIGSIYENISMNEG